MSTINAKNARQTAFLNAFNADTSAARGVVVAFEDVMTGYYGEDSRNPINIQFMLNVMASRPKLQRVAKNLVATLGDFKISIDVELTPANKSNLFYKVTNVKDENMSKADRQTRIDGFIAAVEEFKTRELSSLIEWTKPQGAGKDKPAFTFEKAVETVAKSFDKQIEAALAASSDANLAELKELLLGKLNNAFTQSNLTKINDSIEDKARKEKVRQEEAAIKAARAERNAAAMAE